MEHAKKEASEDLVAVSNLLAIRAQKIRDTVRDIFEPQPTDKATQ